ncbi:MAG: hypothetical protein A3D44_02235 [Candidatus Staskawiczbacteria bacterium RIFCSPHIGHO2_02_FULL_42_22]|uniref:Uncharacterized protein n=1 Tax=Candidatus Staskawiczbacteria bacterium RIFCSPHIGHO2_02_FULL_42_22 TaxID=1802207 RepID=A0A1G2I1V0_9BACT|nr:MAG: hypothetical protein A3D44_02235 [Candidatus Staskawiczbacteria bacterium RIFCSPHIGHO2_02_FULL_42_22]
MEKLRMQPWIWVLVALFAVAAIIFFVFNNKSASNPVTTESESVQDISPQDTGVMASAISYANALVKYADRRIQLDTMCQAHPSNVTYKDNTGIMIDNRSPQTRTVKIGTTFTIKPWGFKIVVLPDVYLKSNTILVDCDNSQNVATILVQE